MEAARRRSGKLVVLALVLFLSVALIYSSSRTFTVSAAPPDPRFETGDCENHPESLTATCCWWEVHKFGQFSWAEWRVCQTCEINTDTGDFENCTEPEIVSRGQELRNSIVAPEPEGVAPPPGPGKGGPGIALPEGALEGLQTAPTPEGPTELPPQVDCNQNPNDPLCETATIPEAGDQDNSGEGGGEQDGNEEPQPEEDQSSTENGNN